MLDYTPGSPLPKSDACLGINDYEKKCGLAMNAVGGCVNYYRGYCNKEIIPPAPGGPYEEIRNCSCVTTRTPFGLGKRMICEEGSANCP